MKVTRIVSARAGRDRGRGRRRGGRADRRRATCRWPARSKPAALVVYDKIDGIKVLPQAGMARVGGAVFPKQLQQFEAVGVQQRPRRQAGHGRRSRARHRRRQVARRGIHRDLRRRRHGVCRHDRRRTGCSRRTSTARTRSAAGNRNNIGDVWVVARTRRSGGGRAQAASRARASAGDRAALHGVVPAEGGR